MILNNFFVRISTSAMKFIPYYLISASLIFYSCQKLEPSAPDADSVMDAPLDGLSPSQSRLFLEGADEFDEIYNSKTGLGPLFVTNSCASCHGGDNRGHPFTVLTRFGQSDTTGNTYLHLGGPQLQDKALPGYQAETLPSGASSTRLIAPIVSGVGFLEHVPDADLMAMADESDADGDGVSGVVNYISLPEWVVPFDHAVSKNGRYIGRFGRKSAAYNLHHQTVMAFSQDMGITTSFMPDEIQGRPGPSPLPAPEPDISKRSVNAAVFYLQALQHPIQRNADDPGVRQGAQIFEQIGCAKCHVPTLKTGHSEIAALSGVEFHPYTDLLLHDMGPELDDGYTEGSALTSEWRTAPLWGLGLAPEAQGGRYFLLHDGRAQSIQEAIYYHGGEASASAREFVELSKSDKDVLLGFLNSL